MSEQAGGPTRYSSIFIRKKLYVKCLKDRTEIFTECLHTMCQSSPPLSPFFSKKILVFATLLEGSFGVCYPCLINKLEETNQLMSRSLK